MRISTRMLTLGGTVEPAWTMPVLVSGPSRRYSLAATWTSKNTTSSPAESLAT